MKSIKVAAVQICASSDKDENYRKVAHYVQKSAEAGARWIVLPEHWNWLGKEGEKRNNAELLTGPSLHCIQGLAKQFRCSIVAGTIAEANDDQPPYNTAVVVAADGTIGNAYRKIHLFDAEVARGYKESQWTSAGKEVVVAAVGEIKIGLSVCYDVRFPELYRQLVTKGAEVIAIPANFTAFTGAPHWEVLVRARAIENQCFVIAADQTGMTGAGWEAHGHSMIVDPWGTIVAIAGKEEGFIAAELDFARLHEVRTKMPVYSHRKL